MRTELEARGYVVHTPDLPCEEVGARVEEYAAAVPAADVVVGVQPLELDPGHSPMRELPRELASQLDALV